jgi:hypothetical protein
MDSVELFESTVSWLRPKTGEGINKRLLPPFPNKENLTIIN